MYKVGNPGIVSFTLVNKIDADIITSGIVTTTFIGASNGGAFITPPASTTNLATYAGSGIWTLILTAAEMSYDFVCVLVTHPDSVPQTINISLEPKLVSDLNDFDRTMETVDIGFVNGTAVTDITDFHTNTSGLSTFVAATDPVTVGTVNSNIIQVTGTAITNIDDFKADVSGITAAFEGTTTSANIVSVNGVAVTDITDFHVNTSGLSTFSPATDKVIIENNAITSTVLDTTAISEIADGVLDEVVDDTVTLRNVAEMLLAFIAGKVTVVDNGSNRTFTFYRRGEGEVSYTVIADETSSAEGQRGSEGTIGTIT